MMKMKNYKRLKDNSGLALVEAMIATSLVLALLISLFAVHNIYLRIALANSNDVKATFLAEEALEVLRFFRDASWENIDSLVNGTNYSLTFNLGSWATTTSNIYIDSMFERRVVLSAVYRDGSSRIVESGGTLDPETRKITVNVSWLKRGATTTKSIATYLSNLLEE